MKISLPLYATLLAAVCGAAAAETVTYIAPGVNVEDTTASTRFYDTGKGYCYWDSHLDEMRPLYEETGDFSYLGSLAGYITQQELSAEAFSALDNDSATCWYNSGANAIQYWQDTYGAFYRNDAPLPNGYTYSGDHLETLAGTQSLQVNMHFYDNWSDTGGAATDGFDWYFGGNDSSGVPQGGFFIEYFYGKDAGKSANLFSAPGQFSMQKATEGIISAFGLTQGGNGLQQTQEGLIATLSVGNNMAAHALTCYGFTLGEDGMLDSLYIADSDDAAYRLERVYLALSPDGGRLLMYEDAEHTIAWRGNNQVPWGITGIYNIATPQRLQNLYAEYNAPETPLLWNGNGSLWATTDTAPAEGPWTASVQGTPYNSNYRSARIACFDDTAQNRNVTVQGRVETLQMRLENAQNDYSFSGADGALLRIGTLDKTGAAAARFTDLAIQADTLILHAAGLELLGTSSLKIADTIRISGGTISSTAETAYSTDNASYTIGNATVELVSDTDTTLRNKLENVHLVNAGTGALTLDTTTPVDFSAEAANGDIAFINQGAETTLNSLVLGDGRTIGIYRAAECTEAGETALLVTGELVAGLDSRLEANLTLGTGATLDVSGTGGLGLTLGSALTLYTGITLSQRDMELISQLTAADSYGLFQGVDEFTLEGLAEVTALSDAAGWFNGFDEGRYFISWNGDSVSLVTAGHVPEPATGTLGLLALAILSARRRR